MIYLKLNPKTTFGQFMDNFEEKSCWLGQVFPLKIGINRRRNNIEECSIKIDGIKKISLHIYLSQSIYLSSNNFFWKKN